MTSQRFSKFRYASPATFYPLAGHLQPLFMSLAVVSVFIEMGGYGIYVWGSFGACALAMATEPWLIAREHRRIVQRAEDPR